MADLKNYVRQQLLDAAKLQQAVFESDDLHQALTSASELAIQTYRNKNKMLFAGNGGSAADAQHLAAEMVSRFNFDRPALPALALNTNTSTGTSIGNDYGYENLFSRQIEAFGIRGDLFVALSTSGNSPNIIKALEVAKTKGLVTLGLTGESGGKMKGLCDHIIRVPSRHTPRIQEIHILMGHIICAAVENALFGKDS